MKRRISIAVLALLPMFLVTLGIQVGTFFAGYLQSRDNDYASLVDLDQKSMFSIAMSVGKGPSQYIPKLKEVYEANADTPIPEDQGERYQYLASTYQVVIGNSTFTNLYNTLPSKTPGDIYDQTIIAYIDEVRNRFVVLISRGLASTMNAEGAGYYYPITEECKEHQFFGVPIYDPILKTNFLFSGIEGLSGQDNDPFVIIRRSPTSSVYAVSDGFRDRFIPVIAVTAGAMVIMMSLFTFVFLLHPIKKLSDASNEYVEGIKNGKTLETFHESKHKFSTEISTLNDSLYYMQDAIRDYTQEIAVSAKKEQALQTELNLAERIQSGMLPTAPLINERYECHGFMVPAKEVGGDFYDFFPIDEDHVGFFVGDVSGKGVPAALFMAKAHTVAELLLKSEDVDTINKTLCQENGELLFVTAFFGIVNLKTKTLRFINCGHEQAYLRHKGSFHPIEQDPNMPLGLDDTFPFTHQQIQLESGDALFIYTDGLSEATNINGELFGRMSLENPLDECAANHGDDFLKALWGKVQDFVGEAPQADDACMVFFEMK